MSERSANLPRPRRRGAGILRALDALERSVIAGLAGAALLLSCWSIAARYLAPSLAADWTFEVIIFLVIWCTFLSSARLVSEGGHIRIDLVLILLPQRVRNLLVAAASLLGVAVAVLLVWSGIRVVEESILWQERTASSLALPMWIYYASLPVGACLLAVRLLVRAVLILRGRIDDMPAHARELQDREGLTA